MFSLSEIPTDPGVYVLRDRNAEVAYVGISKSIRSRVDQHLNRRDSSISTGVSTTCLKPEYVTKVEWWLDPLFADKNAREAAEVVAFDVFNPSLRSRGRLTGAAKAILEDRAFQAKVAKILDRQPDGFHIPKNLNNLCAVVEQLLADIEDLKKAVHERDA